MNGRFAKVAALVAILVLLLTGCAAPAAPAAPAGEAAAAPAAGEAAAPAASDAGTTFRVWWYETGAYDTAWHQALDDFQAAHPDLKIEYEQKTFEQMQQTARMVLNSNDVPDVMEVNKGNGTAGVYASEGLLTNLDEAAAAHGWDKILKPSLQTTARYNDQGIMGSGSMFGVPVYGEYILVFYNKDMFKERGFEVPTTLEEFEKIADAFVAEGIVPMNVGGASGWPLTHNWQELVLYKATREGINDYQFLTGDVDFHNEAFTFGAQKFLEHVQKGYYGDNINGITNDDANNGFAQGKYPMFIGGTWNFGVYQAEEMPFDWGVFLMPDKQFTTGSAGNMWVVPTNAKNKDLAYDFIDMTLAEKAQTTMANAGGIAVNANLDEITDQAAKELNQGFATIVDKDGLAFYPDWPVPGYIDILGAALQKLVAGDLTPDQFNDEIAGPYKEFKDSLQ